MRLLPLLLLLLALGAAAAQDDTLTVWHPDIATAGDPIGILISPDVPGPYTVTLNGEELSLFSFRDHLAAISLVPLGTASASWPLVVQGIGGDGTVHAYQALISVQADPREVEELSIPASVLSLSTDDAREVEAAMRERVWASPLPFPLWSEPFVSPVEGRTTSSYGDPRRYAPGGRVSYHEGTDIAAPTGTPVLATNAGVAVIAAEFPTYPIKGGLVIIDHGAGLMSYYLHLSRVLVEEGATVDVGQVIAEVGSTGLSTGPHLHWEMRLNDRGTNPLVWTGRRLPY